MTARFFSMRLVAVLGGLLGFSSAVRAEVTVTWKDLPGEYASEIDAFLDLARTELPRVLQDQRDLARGMANANAFASQAATLQGYQGYSLVGVMGGLMVGAQLPSFSPAYLLKVVDKIEQDLDVYAGVGVGMALNVGINAGAFGVKIFGRDLYFNVKFLTFSPPKMAGLDAQFVTLGLGANYQVFESLGLLGGLARWRGLSVGTGLLMNHNEAQMELDKGLPADVIHTDNLHLAPGSTLGVDATVVTIPLDVTTAVQLFYLLNLNLGLGMDFNLGHGDVVVALPIRVNDPAGREVGSLSIDASTRGVSPSPVRLRLSTGFGLNLGPVKIDVPLTWYLTCGVSAGISLGAVW